MQNLIDIMIMLCMRPADVKGLCINYYKPNNVSNWYNSEYSWYYTGYAKNKNNEPRPFLSMEKNPVRARELLIWIQKAIPKRFPFLSKGEDDNVNVYPINNFLASYGISSCHLRKIGADHTSRVHGGKNDTRRRHLRQLACRHKIGTRFIS